MSKSDPLNINELICLHFNICVVMYASLHVPSCIHKGLYDHVCTGGGQRLMSGVFLSGSPTYFRSESVTKPGAPQLSGLTGQADGVTNVQLICAQLALMLV